MNLSTTFTSADNGASMVDPLAVFDQEKRLARYGAAGVAGTETYGYDGSNRRILRQRVGESWAAEVTFWAGRRMGIYRFTWDTNYQQSYLLSTVTEDVAIGGRVVRPSDRLGSNLSGGRRMLPYGEELSPGTINDADKFATYRRDMTGLDYADQRYYVPGAGRFMTADPYQASAGPSNPSSWNRFSYVTGDPVNKRDPRGLWECEENCDDDYDDGDDGGGGGGGGDGQKERREQEEYQKSQKRAAAYTKALDGAWKALAVKDCAAIFGGKDVISPESALREFTLYGAAKGRVDVRFGVLNSGTAGATDGHELRASIAPPGTYYERATVTLNTDDWDLDLVSLNTHALLHELGHVISKLSVGSITSDGNHFSHTAIAPLEDQDRNYRLIQEKCIMPVWESLQK